MKSYYIISCDYMCIHNKSPNKKVKYNKNCRMIEDQQSTVSENLFFHKSNKNTDKNYQDDLYRSLESNQKLPTISEFIQETQLTPGKNSVLYPIFNLPCSHPPLSSPRGNIENKRPALLVKVNNLVVSGGDGMLKLLQNSMPRCDHTDRLVFI